MDYAAIIGAAVSLIGGLLGQGKDAEAQSLRESLAAQYGEEILPHLDKALAEQQGATELGKVQEDGSLRAQQLRAMQELESVYANEGMGRADTAALNRAQDTAAGQAGSQYASLTQSLAARGMAPGGGLGVALASQVGQDATNTAGRMAGDAQIAARARALRALEAGAGMAGDVRGTDWGINSEKGRAQDAINAFNTTGRERANYYNRDLAQREWENRMQLLNSRANAQNAVAAGLEKQGQSYRGDYAAAGNAITTLGNYEPKKEKKP